MDIGANLVVFVKMDGCPVRRYSIPQRYTPKRKFITTHLAKDPINFSEKKRDLLAPSGALIAIPTYY